MSEGEQSASSGAVPVLSEHLNRIYASRIRTNVFIVVIIFFIALALAGVGVISTSLLRPVTDISSAAMDAVSAPIQVLQSAYPVTLSRSSSAQYRCAGGKGLSVLYLPQSANLQLSDGRRIALLRSPTDTSLYANADQSFMFRVTATAVSITEDGQVTYAHCTAL